jgi:steroid delta-isomerase-like uncharacterized protein
MVTTTITKLSQDYLNAFNSHDLEKMASYYTSDCTVESVGTGQVKRGMQEIKKYYQDFFTAFPDARMEFTNDFRCNDWSATEWMLTGTHKGMMPGNAGMPELPPTNKKISIKGTTINHIRNDKIMKETDYWNAVPWMQQLGVMPEKKK